MAVNITVNGKFARHCRSRHLSDPQEAKKAEEMERRKLRLLQVREECKKLAKKIRDEVNEEKRRELQKLQETKERELECWRRHALHRKGDEYRDAIFQIGTAHQAAKIENEKKGAKQKQLHCNKDFRREMDARKCLPPKVQFNCQSFCPCQQTLPDVNKQLKCTLTEADEPNAKNKHEVHKRKRNLSFSSSESEYEDDDCKEDPKLPQSSFSISSTSDSTSSFNNNQNTETSTFVPTKNKFLVKTPAVFLDVEMGTDDSITISAPAEVKDKHSEYNRQFNSIIRVSPRKGRDQKQNICEIPSIQQLSTTTLSSDVTARKHNANKTSFEDFKNDQLNNDQVSKEKRFTIISELVKKQQQNEPRTVNHVSSASHLQATSPKVSLQLSPRKPGVASVRPPIVRSPPQSPRKTSALSKSRATATLPLMSFTATAKSNAMSASSSSGRVQFYDYNSKLTKEHDQSATTVNVQKQSDRNQPSAMEHAELENKREKERQLEASRKSQVMEERGQKALEREQIRRDCHDLTEKLDILTREYANQFPTNDNQRHVFIDKQLRKEGKMNLAVEKLLQRPSIITCSEQNKSNEDRVNHKFAANVTNLLNVASINNKPLPADDVSSDSCCSILLGYVDDQSKLIKQDLQNNATIQNQSKQMQLQSLLERLDQLRRSLVEELRNESETKGEKYEKENPKCSSKQKSLRQVIDSISEMRKQHSEILDKDKAPDSKSLNERETELQAKEKLLDRKVREFYELQMQQITTKKDLKQSISKEDNEKYESSANEKKEDMNGTSKDNGNMICASGEKSLEIVITVRGEEKCVKLLRKPKRKMIFKRSPSKLSTLIKRSPQTSLSVAKKHTPKKKSQVTKPLGGKSVLRRRNSYDSNSTSYMSLPPKLPTKIDDLAQCIIKEGLRQPKKSLTELEPVNQDELQETEISLESVNNTSRVKPESHVNPLIAQYVHRLLGMSRNAVDKLGVSSSDIETPGSSIINTADNVTNSDTIISDERLATLQYFIEENKSFIKDLEQSIRLQNNASLENSMRMFDDIWRKRLKRENMESITSKKPQKIKEKVQTDKLATENKVEKKAYLKTRGKKTFERNNVQQTANTKSIEQTDNLLKDLSKSLSFHYSSDTTEPTSLKTFKRPVETSDKAIDVKLSIDSSKSEPDSQIARYAKLTENCTHRIAELTELINRVREEKQRLLEVTLSSVSDNGRQSTEYLDLPEGKSSTRNEQGNLTRVSSSSEETIQDQQSRRSDTLNEMPKLSSAYKNKQITISRDSGIAESRPVTSLENRIEQEPLSQTSSESNTTQSVRKMKPPPTLKRFSPQLPEDEVPHELSTIFEVDTPATSRINTVAGQSTEERDNAFNKGPQQHVIFPTFAQYIKQLDLDITQLDPQQNTQLQQEFATFLECLQQNRSLGESPNYSEFPSINAYIQQLAECDFPFDETMEESLAKLHISGINPRHFPAVREYIKHNKTKSLPSDEQQLLETESLENITDGQTRSNTDNDSASLDIEEELIKRQILKKSFRVKTQQMFSSTAHRDAAFYQEILATESGVDKLSTSGNTIDLLDSDIKIIVQQSPRELGTKSQKIKILSSNTSSTNASSLANSGIKAASSDDSSKGSGRIFNLRDFLTRELEKLANNSGSSANSSSDESLRSHFLHSLIGSLTPCTAGATSKSGAQVLDRQKTSTPVPIQSSQTHSTVSNHSNFNSSNQLFSGESRLSSVHYQDRSERIITSEGGNADQSSE